jgi:hypothetical protein
MNVQRSLLVEIALILLNPLQMIPMHCLKTKDIEKKCLHENEKKITIKNCSIIYPIVIVSFSQLITSMIINNKLISLQKQNNRTNNHIVRFCIITTYIFRKLKALSKLFELLLILDDLPTQL